MPVGIFNISIPELSPEETYRVWLRGCYSETVDKLLELLQNEHENVSVSSLENWKD
jgi:hypothetical protein